ncbi:MAG: MFS transporter [Acidimicrobiales bacterium]
MNGELAERLGESRTAIVEVFRNPGLRRINLALAGSIIGDWAYAVGVSVYAYQEGGATAVGVYGVARYVTMALVVPFMAILADRFDRKRVMVIADVVRFVLVAAAALIIAGGGPAMAVYGLGLLTSVAGTAFRPAQMALLPNLANHPGELTAANVSSTTIESVGFFAGPAIAGGLLALTDVEIVFGFNAVTFLWSAALVSAIHLPVRTIDLREAEDDAADTEPAETGAPGEADPMVVAVAKGRFAQATAGFREILANRSLTILMGLYCAQTVVAGASLVFGVAIAFDLLDMDESGVGLLDAMVGVGGLVGGFLALMLATRGRLAVDFGVGVVLWSAPLLLVVAFPDLGPVLLVMAVLGLGNSLVDINAFTIMQRLVPDAVMGRVFGAVESVLVAGMALGSLAMPVLIHTVGLRTGLLVIGLSVSCLAVASIGALRRIDVVALAPDGLDLIAAVPIFAPLPDRAIERLARCAEVVTVPAGEVVIQRGDSGDRFYVVEAGEAECIISDDLRTAVGPGGSFGEIALLRDVPRQATVVAVTDLTLRAIGRRVFLEVVTGHTEAEAEADRLITRMLVTT